MQRLQRGWYKAVLCLLICSTPPVPIPLRYVLGGEEGFYNAGILHALTPLWMFPHPKTNEEGCRVHLRCICALQDLVSDPHLKSLKDKRFCYFPSSGANRSGHFGGKLHFPGVINLVSPLLM